jgi:hypothetical protein
VFQLFLIRFTMTKKEEEVKAKEETEGDALSYEEEEKAGAPGDEDGKIHPFNNKGKKKDVKKMFPNAFSCPVTKQVLEDPIDVPDGFSYKPSAILECRDIFADISCISMEPCDMYDAQYEWMVALIWVIQHELDINFALICIQHL